MKKPDNKVIKLEDNKPDPQKEVADQIRATLATLVDQMNRADKLGVDINFGVPKRDGVFRLECSLTRRINNVL